jgi:hypothetical protein
MLKQEGGGETGKALLSRCVTNQLIDVVMKRLILLAEKQ